jgi:hypothetical protein
MKGCAARWRTAQTAFGDAADRFAACRGCPIGAPHAGYAHVNYSPWYDVGICPRCAKGTTRMIGNRRCVGCYNRQREMKAGRNARGNLPIKLLERPLRRVDLLLEVDGEARRFVDHESTGMLETIIQVLRATKGQIAFAFAGGGQAPLEVDPFELASDIITEPDEVSAEEADAEGWYLTDLRCRACRGAMMQSVRTPTFHRCADCAGHQHDAHDQVLEAEPSTAGGSAPELGVHRKVDRRRALLFGTSALVQGRWR